MFFCCIYLLKFASYSVDHHLSLISWICIQDFFFVFLTKKPGKIMLCCFPLKPLLIAWAKSVLMAVMLPQDLSPASLVLAFLDKNPFLIHFQLSNQFHKPIQLYPSLTPNQTVCGVSIHQFLYSDPTISMMTFFKVIVRNFITKINCEQLRRSRASLLLIPESFQLELFFKIHFYNVYFEVEKL